MLSRVFLAGIAAALLVVQPASAGDRQKPSRSSYDQFCGDRFGPCVGAAAAESARSARRAAKDGHRRAISARRHQGGFQGGLAARRGLVTVQTAAGVAITASPDFAPKAQEVIAAAVAAGHRFRRINCFDLRRVHRPRSNHKTGDACDAFPPVPARIVRAAGLRSGCDFADCHHFDNARNVGGMPFWNSVRHARGAGKKRHHVVERGRILSDVSIELMPKRKARGVNHGLVRTINAKLRRWVRPTGRCPAGTQEWLATYYGSESGRRTANGERFRPGGLTAAHNSLAFGTVLHVTNPTTGRSVSVRINDRGPATIANIDLAAGAARSIGMRSSAYLCVSGGTSPSRSASR